MKETLINTKGWIIEHILEILFSISILSIGVYMVFSTFGVIEKNNELRKEVEYLNTYIEVQKETQTQLEKDIVKLDSNLKKYGNELKCEKNAYSEYRTRYNITCYTNGLYKDCRLPLSVADKLYQGYQRSMLICVEKYDG